MKPKRSQPDSGWDVVWEGEEPTAGLAEEVLHKQGLDVRRTKTDKVCLAVPSEDAATAKQLLTDWAM